MFSYPPTGIGDVHIVFDGEVDNYISGYNVRLDTENFAKKYGYEHLVNKEIPVANTDNRMPVITLTSEDLIDEEPFGMPLRPNTAEV